MHSLLFIPINFPFIEPFTNSFQTSTFTPFSFPEQRQARLDPTSLALVETILSKSAMGIAELPSDNLKAIVNHHRTEAIHETHLARFHADRARTSHGICTDASSELGTRLRVINLNAMEAVSEGPAPGPSEEVVEDVEITDAPSVTSAQERRRST